MRFIDLFAGLGGFHKALVSLGHNCVFACEIKKDLAKLYEENNGITVEGDIKKIKESDIPSHDILCAGFPCQPFSKAGSQKGLDDYLRGSLFNDIARILAYHKPKYFILENVANLFKHDNGETWAYIKNILTKELNYNVQESILSPHDIGIPQIRQRLFIVGSLSPLNNFRWPEKVFDPEIDISYVLENNPEDCKILGKRENEALNIWQKFLENIPKTTKLPSFPIWATEFGATYPFEERVPMLCSNSELDNFLGAFGKPLKGLNLEEKFLNLPTYALFNKDEVFPKWKQNFIRNNRRFYLENKDSIDKILPLIKELPFSWQKFEWNCQGGDRNIYNYILQFRPSGIRVKKRNYSPALVASTSTQVPIIGWENRYITRSEGAKIQGLFGIKLPESETAAFNALGNAVNAKIVEVIAKRLFLNTLNDKPQINMIYKTKVKTLIPVPKYESK